VLVHDYDEQGDGSVGHARAREPRRARREWTIGPVDHWHQDGPEALGVILKHPSIYIDIYIYTYIYMYIYIFIYI
jgi:hypothetical protein